MLEVVKQVSTLLWPYLFGRQPDSVERDDTVRSRPRQPVRRLWE